jgi:hypothetical protein
MATRCPQLALAAVRFWWKADVAEHVGLSHHSSMRIHKDTLPSGQSYALKPSMLENALKAGAIQTETVLHQWRAVRVENRALFRAHFYPAGQYYRSQDELLTITSHAIPMSVRAAATAFIEGAVIPDFIKWISGLEALPISSTIRMEKQSFG